MPVDDVFVLFGGASSERRVSVASAQHMLALLPKARAFFESPLGSVHAVKPEDLAAFQQPFETDFVPKAAARFPNITAMLDSSYVRGAVFLLAYHGTFGEDGQVQLMLESRGLAFTGSGADASAKAFDKTWAKKLVFEHGVLCAEQVDLPPRDAAAIEAALLGLLQRHGRAVAKPVAGGSSVGLYHLLNAQDAKDAAPKIAETTEAYLAEAFVEGTEVTVGIVDGVEGSRALPVTEVRIDAGRAFDFDGKYLGKGTLEITPAELPAETIAAAQQVALTAHKTLGCYGYSRTDVICSPRGPVFLELNTLPGMTRRSFIPQQLAAEGTSVRDFLEAQLALGRMRAKINRMEAEAGR
jgi:D-alanine-D-alanine ligase